MKKVIARAIICMVFALGLLACSSKSSSDTPPSAATFSISGTVTSSGSGLQGVTMTLNSSTATTTDASGNYTLTGLTNGTYTLTPSLAGYLFTPPSIFITISNANSIGNNFIASASASAATTIWKATNPFGYTRTSGYSSSYSGQSTRYDTLVINLSGTSVSGTWYATDTLGSSIQFAVTGSMSGNNINIQVQDTVCNRTVTGTGTMGSSSLTLSASGPATGSCASLNSSAVTFTLTTPTIYTASGTYAYTASSQTLTMNWTNTNAPAGGRMGIGTGTLTNINVTSTTLQLYGTTFTRQSGSVGDVTGTWTFINSAGDVWEFIFNSDGTASQTADSHFLSNSYAYSWHDSNGYEVGVWLTDQNHTATAVSVSGAGINGSLSLTYDSNRKQWKYNGNGGRFSLGTTHALPPLTYTFSITTTSGTSTDTAGVTCFVEDFATPLSAPISGGSQTYTWTKVPYAMRYAIDMGPWVQWTFGFGDNNTSLFDVSSVLYTGPALTLGTLYNYNLEVLSADYACRTVNQVSFTY